MLFKHYFSLVTGLATSWWVTQHQFGLINWLGVNWALVLRVALLGLAFADYVMHHLMLLLVTLARWCLVGRSTMLACGFHQAHYDTMLLDFGISKEAQTIKLSSIAKSPRRFLSQLLMLLTALLLLSCADASSDAPVANPEKVAKQAAAPPVHQRPLPLNNTLNSRDIGGYATSDGRTVQWGKLYRSDSLANLDEADLAYLEKLQLATVFDFRSDTERAEAPDRLPQQSPAIVYRTLAINNPAVDVAELGRKFYSGQLSQAELVALTDRREYINNTALSREWGQWLRELAEPGALPQLFHCTAGKDRTGFAAAIVLLTLGVSKEDVMQDFLLSNELLAHKIEYSMKKIQEHSSAEIDADLLRQVIGVTPVSLEGAFQAMEANYGSIDGFIEHGLGIDESTRLKLQELLLE